jgi:hypothetical protein
MHAAHVQGCLGWDHKREKRQGTYPATLTSDKWFVLASRTQHVLHMLRQCEDLSEVEALTEGGADGTPLQHQGRIQLVQKLVDATHTLQGVSRLSRSPARTLPFICVRLNSFYFDRLNMHDGLFVQIKILIQIQI